VLSLFSVKPTACQAARANDDRPNRFLAKCANETVTIELKNGRVLPSGLLLAGDSRRRRTLVS